MSAPKEIRVASWSELQERLFEEAWNPDIRRFRSKFAFRGLSDANCRLITSLARIGGPFAEMEAHLLRNFRKYALRDVVEADSVWHWLSLAQHHGLPTRLLDFTYSPFVAMHFATADLDKFGTDGAIMAIHYGKAHELLPEPFKAELAREGSDVLTLEMLAAVVGSLRDLDTLSPEPFLSFLEPPSMDDRIVNQYALFSILSDAKAGLDEWLDAHPGLGRKIIIPAELKWEIRDKLDQANITERVLFPGLDGLSRWLKRLYSTRDGGEPPG
jgi:hypothetical protein